MYKLAKIFCKNISNYRHFNPRVTHLLLGSVASRGPNVRLSVPQIKFNKPKCKIVNPGNVTLAISILTWLGFADEDAGKESELIMTLKRAVLCTQREEYDKAERMLHLALRIAQQQQNEQGIIYCYDLMANLAFDQYQLDKAEKLFVSVLQMLLSKGVLQDDLKVIHISLKLARICQLRAELDKAELGYKYCLEQIESQKNKDVDSQILYGVINDWYAQFLLDKNEVSSALIHLKEAYEVCNETKGKDSEKSLLLLNDLGITSFRAEDVDGAEKYLKEALSIGEQLEDKFHLGVVHANLGLILLHKGITADAEKFCNEALSLGKKYENPECVDQANYCFDQIKLNLGK